MNLTRSIFTISLITLGLALFILFLWFFVTSPDLKLISFSFGFIGLVFGYIGWLLRTSVKSFNRSLLSTGLIVLGTGLIILYLFPLVGISPIASLIYRLLGLVIGISGWLLRKPKKPMSLIRNISSGFLLTIGLAIFVYPILILTLYGTNTTFVNIALMNFVVGLIVGLIGVSVRNQRSK